MRGGGGCLGLLQSPKEMIYSSRKQQILPELCAMRDVVYPGKRCHLCVGYIAPTEWYHQCLTCGSEQPKQPNVFCSACITSAAHCHPTIRERSCECDLKIMDTFAASLLNRFTAFSSRPLFSFPLNHSPLLRALFRHGAGTIEPDLRTGASHTSAFVLYLLL